MLTHSCMSIIKKEGTELKVLDLEQETEFQSWLWLSLDTDFSSLSLSFRLCKRG